MENLTIINEIKENLKIDLSETKYDSVLELLNQLLSASVRMWAGKDLSLGTYIERFDIDKKQTTIFLHQYPVIKVIKFIFKNHVMKQENDFFVYDNIGVIKIRSDYPFENEIETYVEYQAGYPIMPDTIKQAVLKLIYREFYDRGIDDIFKIDIGTYSSERSSLLDDMPLVVYRLLYPYRRQCRAERGSVK